MLIKETLRILLVTIIAKCDWITGTSQLSRPILIGPLVGLMMGDLKAGIIMGATLELAFIGAVSIGAAAPPDTVSGTILGVAFAIKSGAGAKAALVLGLPIATVVLVISTIVETPISLALVHYADRCAARGSTHKVGLVTIIGGFLQALPTTLLIPIAYYVGSDAVVSAINKIPVFVQTGMGIACQIIPAIGFAMLVSMIVNKKVAPFFFIGYFLVISLKLSVITIAIFAISIACILIFNETKKEPAVADNSTQKEVELDEF